MKFIKGSLTLMLLLILLMVNTIGESMFFLHNVWYSLCFKTYNHIAADNLGVIDMAIQYIATITIWNSQILITDS